MNRLMFCINFMVVFIYFLLIHWIHVWTWTLLRIFCTTMLSFDSFSKWFSFLVLLLALHCKGNVSWSFTHSARWHAINWNIKFSSTDKNYFHDTILSLPITHGFERYVVTVVCSICSFSDFPLSCISCRNSIKIPVLSFVNLLHHFFLQFEYNLSTARPVVSFHSRVYLRLL